MDEGELKPRLTVSNEGLVNKNYNLLSNLNIVTTDKRKKLNGAIDFCTPPEVRRKNSLDIHCGYNWRRINLREVRVVLNDIGLDWRYNVKGERPEVVQILGKKNENGSVHYLVKWRNETKKLRPMQHNSWEPEENLADFSNLVTDFENGRLRAIQNLKRKIGFFPGMMMVNRYIERMGRKGRALDVDPVDEEKLYRKARTFLRGSSARVAPEANRVKDIILRLTLNKFRQKQLESLKNWQDAVNSVSKGKPKISVENLVDLEELPKDFYYMNAYLPGVGITIPNDPPIGCQCKKCGPGANCCFTQGNHTFPYTQLGRVQIPPGTPIYECNRRCECDRNCPNRVVQRGGSIKLCIFRTDNGRGWGVKSLEPIRKGTFVTEFVGEVITSEEAEKRGQKYDLAGRTYLFDLDYNETGSNCPYTVDAKLYGNISRFINHSCNPNLAVYAVWVDCLDPNLPRLAMFSVKDIQEQEELTFNYVCQVAGAEDVSEVQKQLQEDLGSKTLCKCGDRNCRKYLF